MPYRLSGRTVMKYEGGRWIVLKRHPTVAAARAHLAALGINVMAKERGRERRK